MPHELENQLTKLRRRIIEMADLARMAVETAMRSLKERGLLLAEKVIINDDQIDETERGIERMCTYLVVTRQPYATDLRVIVSGYKIISALDRMGDLAADAARVPKQIGAEPLIKELIDLPKMAEIVNHLTARFSRHGAI